jgi:erythromycin esterase-like protein
VHATLLAALRVLAPFVAAVLACGHAQAASQLPANPDALAEAMRGKRIVVLGEVHDNAAQHALRLAALRKLVAELQQAPAAAPAASSGSARRSVSTVS